jgi:hypothetical protein
MSGPFSGLGGKPVIGQETSDHRFVGRVVIELFEGQHIDSDADGLALIINPAPGSGLSQRDLLKRISDALPGRVALFEKSPPPGYTGS